MKMTTDSHNSTHFYVNVNFPKTARVENFPTKLIESLREYSIAMFTELGVL